MKLSNTSIDSYKRCPREYKLDRIDKIKPNSTKSPLFFGIALDEAQNRLLLDKMKPEKYTKEDKELLKKSMEEVFEDHMRVGKINYVDEINLKTSLRARYSKKDYVESFLNKEDLDELTQYLKKNGYEETDPIKARSLIDACDYAKRDNLDRVFMNMGSWMSLRRKGLVMLQRYKEDLYPLIEEVISIQNWVDLPEIDEETGKPTGRTITGKIDFRARIKGYEGVTTVDNKSSSQKYVKAAVERSQQLGIYTEYTGDPWAAYMIVMKNLTDVKVKTCPKCKMVIEGGKQKSCKECKVELEVEIDRRLETQFLIGKPDPEIRDAAFEEFVEIGDQIEEGYFPKDMSKGCFAFGAKCCYYQYCRTGDMKGLVDMKKK